MALTTQTLRVLLRTALISSKSGGGGLLEVLQKGMIARNTEAEQSRIRTGVGTGDSNVTFTMLPVARPDYRAEGYSQLLDLYDTARANLTAQGTAEPQDQAVGNEMLGLLAPVTESYNDFSLTGRPRLSSL